jgi:DNA-binding MarR family transcriptional regulator
MTGNEAVTDVILREIRELGESIILIDQHPSLISMPALGNTYTTVCMNLKHKADMGTISESLLLVREQVDFLGQLETGTAIVKLQGRHFLPFLVKIPLFPIRKGKITDEDIRMKNGGCSWESEIILLEKEINEVIRLVRGLVREDEREAVLGDEERGLLADIARFPVSGVTTRYSRLGLSRHQGNLVQKGLIEKGLVMFRSVSSLKGRLKVLVLTDEGKKAIRDVKMEKVFCKNASWEHEYWKYRIGMHYKKEGYSVTFECKIGEGKSVDVVAEKDGIRIAIEIETGKSDYVYNVKKDLEFGFEEIQVAALDKNTKEKIIRDLKESGLDGEDRVKVVEIEEFLKNGDV